MPQGGSAPAFEGSQLVKTEVTAFKNPQIHNAALGGVCVVSVLKSRENKQTKQKYLIFFSSYLGLVKHTEPFLRANSASGSPGGI